MTQITENDFLEIRDSEGETLHKSVGIYEIHNNTIYSRMGSFTIDGSKNQAGEETFVTLVSPFDYNPTHAVKQHYRDIESPEKFLNILNKGGKIFWYSVEEIQDKNLKVGFIRQFFKKMFKSYKL